MNLATLRVEGIDAALAEVTETLALDICAEWKAGDTTWKVRTRTASGFNATVADAENRIELQTSIRTFLEACRTQRISFTSLGLTAQLDVGLGVCLERQFTAGVEFMPSDLAIFSEIGLELRISAYPCSDDADEDASDT